MTELVRVSAFRSSNGSDSEESTGLFQQEAVIDGPNELQSGLLADGLEATLNRLVRVSLSLFSCLFLVFLFSVI